MSLNVTELLHIFIVQEVVNTKLISFNYTGILHIASKDSINKYDFGIKLCRELNLNENTAEVSENLKLSFDGQIYSADSILVDLSERKILRSTNVRYEAVNDWNNKNK